MDKPIKILIAGIGGQGVVYLTNLITEAAISAGIPVASSEIHGLAQRRGSVMAAVTFGENSFGYIEQAGANYLIGLEPLEAQRCFSYLNKDSRVIIDNNRKFPHSVTSGKTTYPDVDAFVEYLKKNIQQVIFNLEFDKNLNPLLRNTYILGRTTQLDDFPIPPSNIEQVIAASAKAKYREESVKAFRLGMKCSESPLTPLDSGGRKVPLIKGELEVDPKKRNRK